LSVPSVSDSSSLECFKHSTGSSPSVPPKGSTLIVVRSAFPVAAAIAVRLAPLAPKIFWNRVVNSAALAPMFSGSGVGEGVFRKGGVLCKLFTDGVGEASSCLINSRSLCMDKSS